MINNRGLNTCFGFNIGFDLLLVFVLNLVSQKSHNLIGYLKSLPRYLGFYNWLLECSSL